VRQFFEFLRQNPLVLFVLLAWIAGMVGNLVKAAKRSRERAEQAARQRHGELPSAEARSAPPSMEPRPIESRAPEPRPSEPRHGDARNAEQIAREMRRILGVEEPTQGDVATVPPPLPREQREPPARRQHRDRTQHEERVRAERAAREAKVRAERDARESRVRAERAAREAKARAERAARESRAPRWRDGGSAERPPAPVVPTTSSRRLEIHVDPHVGEAIQRRGSVKSGRVGDHAASHELGRLGGRVAAASHRRATAHRYALVDLKRVIVLNEILGPPLALRRGEREV
jgi:colicin import membrane protein